MMGDWPFELSGDELLRRNVRFTPLPGFNEGKALDVVAALPEMAMFSSDYPHQEGNADPINVYGDALAGARPGHAGALHGRQRRRRLRAHGRPALTGRLDETSRRPVHVSFLASTKPW